MTMREVNKGYDSLSWHYFVFLIFACVGAWIMCLPGESKKAHRRSELAKFAGQGWIDFEGRARK